MVTFETATDQDVWPDPGYRPPPAVRAEIRRLAKEITPQDIVNSGCTFPNWYARFFLAEERLKAREQLGKTLQQQEIEDLRKRLRALEQWFELDKEGSPNVLGPVIDVVAEALARTDRKLRKELGDRIEALEQGTKGTGMQEFDPATSRALTYEGVWRADREYRVHSLITHQGSGWVAVLFPEKGEKPGAGSTAWRLAIKGDEAFVRQLVKEELSKKPVAR